MDQQPRAPLRTVSNPPNPWHKTTVDWIGEPPKVELEVREDATRSILSRNESPDIPFRWSVNPYRGCFHGCAYCYARPSHQHLDLGAGTDFERILVVKPRAPELLREAFLKRSWRGELVVFSGNTDCYQPLEASYELTRRCLEVCLEFRNPVSIITKSALVERDAELLATLAQQAHCTVAVSIPFFDAARARAIEPYVPSPQRRLRAVETLARAGVPVGVSVSPVIPGLNDQDIPQVLRAAREAGATYAWTILVRLPGAVREVFSERLRAALPMVADKVHHQIEQCRGGAATDARFGERMRGTGERWRIISDLFESTRRRLGYEEPPPVPDPSPFRRPGEAEQLSLL
jgi:DNA repair photolyase